jgi:hypothetical protein
MLKLFKWIEHWAALMILRDEIAEVEKRVLSHINKFEKRFDEIEKKYNPETHTVGFETFDEDELELTEAWDNTGAVHPIIRIEDKK